MVPIPVQPLAQQRVYKLRGVLNVIGGHLSTMMNAHFAAAVPHLRIVEIDIDRLSWDHELFTHEPEIRDGHLVVPDRPGWGTEPVGKALRAHPPSGKTTTLDQKKIGWIR